MSYLPLVYFIDCKVVKCSRVLLLNKCGVIFLLDQVRPHTLHKKKNPILSTLHANTHSVISRSKHLSVQAAMTKHCSQALHNL